MLPGNVGSEPAIHFLYPGDAPVKLHVLNCSLAHRYAVSPIQLIRPLPHPFPKAAPPPTRQPTFSRLVLDRSGLFSGHGEGPGPLAQQLGGGAGVHAVQIKARALLLPAAIAAVLRAVAIQPPQLRKSVADDLLAARACGCCCVGRKGVVDEEEGADLQPPPRLRSALACLRRVKGGRVGERESVWVGTRRAVDM